MRIATLTASTALLVVVSARGAEITTDQKQFVISSDRRHVMVQGTWGRTSERVTVEVPRVNSVRIECDRTAGVCNEYVAKFIQKTDDPAGTMERPYLFLMMVVPVHAIRTSSTPRCQHRSSHLPGRQVG